MKSHIQNQIYVLKNHTFLVDPCRFFPLCPAECWKILRHLFLLAMRYSRTYETTTTEKEIIRNVRGNILYKCPSWKLHYIYLTIHQI